MDKMQMSTVDVYNTNAEAMAEKFRNIPPRTKDIELAFTLAGSPKQACVVDIGCGDGRDAKEIVKRAKTYIGFDPAKELIGLARKYVPGKQFELADAVSFEYPQNIDVVFAFASFLHLSKEEVSSVFNKLDRALKVGGVIYLSLKWAAKYKLEINEDRFGLRHYYFYNTELIKELAGPHFAVVHERHEHRPNANHADWLELVLKKTV